MHAPHVFGRDFSFLKKKKITQWLIAMNHGVKSSSACSEIFLRAESERKQFIQNIYHCLSIGPSSYPCSADCKTGIFLKNKVKEEIKKLQDVKELFNAFFVPQIDNKRYKVLSVTRYHDC